MILPDAGESAAISSSFLRLVIFPVGRLRRHCSPAQVTQTVGRFLAKQEEINKKIYVAPFH